MTSPGLQLNRPSRVNTVISCDEIHTRNHFDWNFSLSDWDESTSGRTIFILTIQEDPLFSFVFFAIP